MERLELKITGMSCGHCVSAVRKALGKVTGLKAVDVAVGSATVEVEDANAGARGAREAVESAGFEVASLGPAAREAAQKPGGGCCCGSSGKCG